MFPPGFRECSAQGYSINGDAATQIQVFVSSPGALSSTAVVSKPDRSATAPACSPTMSNVLGSAPALETLIQYEWGRACVPAFLETSQVNLSIT